jgi:hypothetical protein
MTSAQSIGVSEKMIEDVLVLQMPVYQCLVIHHSSFIIHHSLNA